MSYTDQDDWVDDNRMLIQAKWAAEEELQKMKVACIEAQKDFVDEALNLIYEIRKEN